MAQLKRRQDKSFGAQDEFKSRNSMEVSKMKSPRIAAAEAEVREKSIELDGCDAPSSEDDRMEALGV